MINLLLIAVRNLKRNWFRTVLTILGTAVALLMFMGIRTLIWAWNAGVESAATDRLGTRHKVSFILPLPKRYADDMRQVPGIKEVTYMSWVGHRVAAKPQEFFSNFAAEGETVFKVYDEIKVSEEDKARWMADKKGCVIGIQLAKKFGWKVGDKITLEGTIYPGDWDFNVSAIYTTTRNSMDESSLFFHWSYLNDSVPPAQRDTIGWLAARVTDDKRSGEISKAVDAIFDERDTQTATMSEHAMMVGFMAGFTAVLDALAVVSVIILLIMLLILGNTIAMGVRERTREYAVLRAIGFEPWHVRFFVVAEAAVLGLLAGGTGVAIGYLIINGPIRRWIEENAGAYIPVFRLQTSTSITALVVAIALAGIASFVPAYLAGRISVTDALRRVG